MLTVSVLAWGCDDRRPEVAASNQKARERLNQARFTLVDRDGPLKLGSRRRDVIGFSVYDHYRLPGGGDDADVRVDVVAPADRTEQVTGPYVVKAKNPRRVSLLAFNSSGCIYSFEIEGGDSGTARSLVIAATCV